MNLEFKTATGDRWTTVNQREGETFSDAVDRALTQLDAAAERANEATIAAILGKGDSLGDEREEYVNGYRYKFDAGFWLIDPRQERLIGPDVPRWYTVGEMLSKKRQEADELRMAAAERKRLDAFKHPLSAVKRTNDALLNAIEGKPLLADRDYCDENDFVIPDGSGYEHDSDCAVNNGPALPVGDCDCGLDATYQNLRDAEDLTIEIGSVVELISGGPAMTVVNVLHPGPLGLSDVAECIWFDANDQLATAKIETAFLVEIVA